MSTWTRPVSRRTRGNFLRSWEGAVAWLRFSRRLQKHSTRPRRVPELGRRPRRGISSGPVPPPAYPLLYLLVGRRPQARKDVGPAPESSDPVSPTAAALR
jgi:hypothetical protein